MKRAGTTNDFTKEQLNAIVSESKAIRNDHAEADKMAEAQAEAIRKRFKRS